MKEQLDERSLMKDPLDERPPVKDYLHERPPWWQTTMMTDHPDERPPWRNTTSVLNHFRLMFISFLKRCATAVHFSVLPMSVCFREVGLKQTGCPTKIYGINEEWLILDVQTQFSTKLVSETKHPVTSKSDLSFKIYFIFSIGLG